MASANYLRGCCIAFIAVANIDCGGRTADVTAGVSHDSSGGSDASGGSNSSGASAATGGNAGCATRVTVYANDAKFPFENRGISDLNLCIPTCGQPYDSIQSMPAGTCSGEPACVVMIASGIPRYFLCSCVADQWSCVSVSGAP